MERRRYKRVPANILLDIHERGNSPLRGRGRIYNLSWGGIGIETQTDIPSNEVFFFRVNLPLEFQGKIVFKRERGEMRRYGIRFHKLGLFRKWKLRKYAVARFAI